MFYRNLVDIKVEKDCPKEIVDVCPLKILKLKEEKITIEDPEKCDMCEVCVEECEKRGKKDCIKLVPKKEFEITLESFGQMSLEELFNRSIKILKKDLLEIQKNKISLKCNIFSVT